MAWRTNPQEREASGAAYGIPIVRRQAVLTSIGAKTGLWTDDLGKLSR